MRARMRPNAQPHALHSRRGKIRLSIYRAIREGRLAAVTDTVERVLGRKAIPFHQWVQENAAAFR